MVGISGTEHRAWILPTGTGALFAVAHATVLPEFTPTSWTDVPLPSGVAGAVRCRSGADLLAALHRVRVLLAQLPPAPQQKLAQRLAAVDATEKEVLVVQRIGQDLFREILMEYWQGRCAVTGLDVPQLLRASHAKPWKDSDDRERLDVYNGLLLAVLLDVLFDQGLITIRSDGAVTPSPLLQPNALRLLLPDVDDMRVERLVDMHLSYLRHHQQHVFRQGPAPAAAPGVST